MILKAVVAILSVPVMAYGMEHPDKPLLPFYGTYHKKRTMQEALDNGLPTKKQHMSSSTLLAFEAAVDQHDITEARQILVDSNYQPKYITLSEAIRLDDLPDMIYWLGAQRNVRPEDDSIITALHAATAYGNDFFIKLLLRAGADVNERNAGGWTPLHFAVWQGRPTAMALLLDNGADPHALSMLNQTPLYNITRYYNFDYRGVPIQWVQELIMKYICHAQCNPQKGADVTQESKDRIKTLLLALYRTCPGLPKVLRHKIVSYMPEDIYSLALFRLTFAHAEQDSSALAALIEQCPFAWFKALCAAKNTPEQRQRLIATIAPLIATYRIGKLPTFLPALDSAQLMYPGSFGPKSMVKRCIKRAIKENLVLKTVIDTLEDN